jgi:signal transduction histidine kinase
MGTLLQNLTDFVHLSTGRRTFDLRENSLRPIVERALDKMRGAAETAGVRVVVDVAADLRVSCDADAIALALEHLLANAIRYSPHGSDVHVEALVSAAGGPNLIDLRVRDAGPGIAAERLPHVFDTYWNARQKARDGVGLGLGIVGAIAEAHGGSPVAGTSSHGASVGFTLRKI